MMFQNPLFIITLKFRGAFPYPAIIKKSTILDFIVIIYDLVYN